MLVRCQGLDVLGDEAEMNDSIVQVAGVAP